MTYWYCADALLLLAPTKATRLFTMDTGTVPIVHSVEFAAHQHRVLPVPSKVIRQSALKNKNPQTKSTTLVPQWFAQFFPFQERWRMS